MQEDDHGTAPDPRSSQAGQLVRRLRMRHIELLDLLAAEGTLRAVATKMNLSQPAISKMLRDIEQVWGMELFERSRSGARATPAGAALIRHARAMLQRLISAGEELQEIRAGSSSLLRLGAHSTTALLPRALTLLRRKHPSLLVRIREDTPLAMITQLLGGELDAVVSALPPALLPLIDLDALRIEPMAREELCVVAAPGHPLARRRRLEWREVIGRRWALPPPEALMRQKLIETCLSLGLPPPRPVVESMSAITMRWLVRYDSDMLGVMRLHQAADEKALGLLQILPVAPTIVLPDLALIVSTRHSSVPAGLADALAAALRKCSAVGGDSSARRRARVHAAFSHETHRARGH